MKSHQPRSSGIWNTFATVSVPQLSGTVNARVIALTCQTPRPNETLASGYGIFGGRDTQTARLCFTPERARWVATETWHPQQKGWFDDEGSYVLEFPDSDDRELIMDILRQGPAVDVISPAPLRKRIQEQAGAILRQYR